MSVRDTPVLTIIKMACSVRPAREGKKLAENTFCSIPLKKCHWEDGASAGSG